MDRTEKVVLSCFLLVVIFGLCLGVACFLTLKISGTNAEFKGIINTLTIPNAVEEATATLPVPTATASAPQSSNSGSAQDTLDALKNTVIPESDWTQLAEEFYGIKDVPTTLSTTPGNYQIGDQLKFWVIDSDTNENQQVTATLRYKTTDIYFWIENGIDFDQATLKKVVDTFANHIYPTDQEFFGKEWIPGVDNDPHLYILYTHGMGQNVAGYTSFTDSYLTQLQQYSNEHEMFYLSADSQPMGDSYTLSVMAHEFQHLIHGYHDKNEELWLNEGFSELAVYLNGYSTGGFDELFAEDPDIQLTLWPNDADKTDAHYGSSFLFTLYVLDRFGENTTKAIVADPLNGLNSLDDVFKNENLTDSSTGQTVTSDGVFQDWTIANFLDNSRVGDGRYSYHNFSELPDFSQSEATNFCSSGTTTGDVSQYGTDYYSFQCNDPFTITFTGSPTVKLLSENPIDGTHYVWSNMSDNSATQMTQTFNFSNVSGPIDMSFDVWYDIEQDYDYGYLLASTDGTNWKLLDTPSCTTDNVVGNNFGCGYNGTSNGWLHEEVDLSQFAGEKVSLRFEYITDEGVTGEGMVIDNISIPQINYSTSFENDEGGWNLQGFTRIENQIPQDFLVSVIRGTGSRAKVEKYQVVDGQPLTISFDPNSEGESMELIISGGSRFTRQKAAYTFSLARN